MGEIADMMLEGILCQCCGELLETEEPAGFPQFCPECAPDDMPAEDAQYLVHGAPPAPKKKRRKRKRKKGTA